MASLVWFRSDLRTHDNTALHHACKASATGGGVVAIFLISPGEWRAHDYAPAKVDLILRTASELSSSLAGLNMALLVRTARTPAEIPRMLLDAARSHGCDTLWFNREYEHNEAERDAAVTGLFEQSGCRVHACTDQTLLPPGEVRTGEGRPYTVFTPFRKACVRLLAEQGVKPWPVPRKRDAMLGRPEEVPPKVDGWETSVPPDRWPAGERHARKRLSAFLESGARAYKETRDFPALPGTSELSPCLTIGSISPRQCVAGAAEANKGLLDGGGEGPACWISEVLWHEFYVHVMHSFPRVCKHRAFLPWTERVAWRRADSHFEAWTQGRTGVPIVDAGMRQLLAEGWMHNRVRMITAMYLSKNLLIDWRRGERWFMQHLVDGFLASNNGGWQWSASTGTDAAPYFRIFNPVSQSRKFDPRGEYIRRYVPELAGLDADSIHDPSGEAPLARANLDYPDMLVDLSSSRQQAIAAFQAARV